MLGYHEAPITLSGEAYSLSVEKEDGLLTYRRKSLDERTEKKIIAKEDIKILVSPVEPVNLPKEITQHLQIVLETPLIIGPKLTKRIFLKFPLEIGVFITGGDKSERIEVIDIFTLTAPKFSLYGDPSSGTVCKYFSSDVYPAIPPLVPLAEGIIELDIINRTNGWSKIGKVVFNAFRMKIYFEDNMVSMKGSMIITGEDIAETDFEDKPLKKGLNKALELYVSRKLPIMAAKFAMEWGI